MQQQRPFQIHFSQYLYEEIYDETDSANILISPDQKKSIYTIKQRGNPDTIFVAKKYTFKKLKFLKKIWDEIDSVVKMRDHDHPNVIKYHDVFLFDQNTVKFGEFQVCIMVMEKGDMTLEDFVQNAIDENRKQGTEELDEEEQTIKKNRKIQNQQEYEIKVYDYLKQTLNGCKFLKSKNIYHRDYKPMNLVLLNNQVKIIDFDIAKVTQLDQTQQISSVKGTENYMDPNLLKIWNNTDLDQDNPEIKYNLQQMDIYSIGATFLKLVKKWNCYQYSMYVMKTKQYFQYNQFKDQESHLQQEIQQIKHQKLKLLLGKMLVLDLQKRWNLEECIQEQQLQQDVQQPQIQQQQLELNEVHSFHKDIKQLLQQQEQFKLAIQDLKQEDNQNNQNNQNVLLTQQQISDLDKEKYTLQLNNNYFIDRLNSTSLKNLEIEIREDFLRNKALQISNIIQQQKQLVKLSIKDNSSANTYDTQLILQSIKLSNVRILSTNIQYSFVQEISQLSNLQALQLTIQNNKYASEYKGVEGAQMIKQGIQKLTNLQTLQLSIDSKSISEQVAFGIGQGIKYLSNLQILQLNFGYENKIDVDGAQSIAQGIAKLSNLQILQLTFTYNNNIGIEGAQVIGSAIGRLSNLQELKLAIGGYNKIGTKGAQRIGQRIGNLSKLQKLELSIEYNNFSGIEGTQAIGQGIGQLSNLQTLQLNIGSDNNMGVEGAQAIGQGIGKLSSLQTLQLNISDNKIGLEGAQSIGKSISQLNILLELQLYIYDSSIGNKGVFALGNSIMKIQNLKSLSLRFGFEGKEIKNLQELQQFLIK